MTLSLARNVVNLGNVLSTSGQYATQATPPILDASSNLATTQFFKNSGKTYSAVNTIAASAALPLSYQGSLCTTSVTGLILTLPALGSSPPGFVITFYNSLATGTLTIKGSTTESISTVLAPAGVNTLVLNPGESVEIISKSTTWLGVSFVQLNTPAFASPTVTTTPALFDSSLKVPNTSWIQTRGLQANTASRSISAANTTLTTADMGSILYFFSGSNQAVTLPVIATVPVGATVILSAGTGGTLAVTAGGGAAVIDTGAGVLATVTLVTGDNIVLTCRGTVWTCSGTLPFRLGWLQGQLNTVNTNITNEANTRAANDNTLQNNINNEATNRNNGDVNLQNQINNEATNRNNGDNNLQNQINAIRSVFGIGSYYFLQQSEWAGGWGSTGTGTISGRPGNWQIIDTTQISGDN